MCFMSASLLSFLSAYHLLGGFGFAYVVSWILIRMWSRLITQLSLGLHYIMRLFIPSVMKVKSITLSLVPLLKVASPLSVIRWRPCCCVSWSRWLAWGSYSTCIPPQAGWWALKSPRMIISPSASLRAFSICAHIRILGPLSCGLYTLIMLRFPSSVYISSFMMWGPYIWCLH